MSVREAQEKVSSREFAEWVAYYSIQPFGEGRLDEHNAWQCYWQYATMCDGNMKPKDFMLTESDDDKATTIDDKMAMLQAISTRK